MPPRTARAKTRATPRRGPPERLQIGPLDQLLGFHLRRAQVRVYADFMRGSPHPDLTPGQTAVLILIQHNANLTQQRLTDALQVEKSTLVVLLHRLEAQGLLRRVRSTEDRRNNVLELTAAGKKTVQAMLAHIADHEARVFGALSKTEQKRLLALLRRVSGQR